jgi:fructuronate reductase/mannitol 2-dehydrogenase
MADPVYRRYLETMMAEEIVPLLDPVPGIDLGEYQRTLVERLANPRMGDELARLCRRGSTKVPNYLLPSIRGAMEQDRPHRLLVLAVAGWLRFLRGYDYAGNEMPVEGPRMHLIGIAQEAQADPRPLLAQEDVFGALGEDPAFVEAVEAELAALEGEGPREAIERCLGEREEAR